MIITIITQCCHFPFRHISCVICLAILVSSCSSPENTLEEQTLSEGFFTSIYNTAPLDATLIFDLDSLIYYKESKKEVQGMLILEKLRPIPLELRARGVFRKATLVDHNWGPYRNYKLVTHCSDTTATDELLLREYLIYKMYEELSTMSFRTQLLRLQYQSQNDTITHFAFLIENEKEMSDRLGLQEMDIKKTKLKTVQFDHYRRFALFQYMVGNTDWNMSTGHNTKYVLEENSDTPIIIPYDFDCSGLVNAPYAMPYKTLPIEEVRERYFMYRGKKTDDFDAILSDFIGKKEAFYSLVNDFSYLSDDAKNDVLKYIGEFYKIIENPDWKDQLFPSDK
jgi:hypothetical protein